MLLLQPIYRQEAKPMKFGLRKPSLRKRLAARTSLKRYVRHSLGIKAPRGGGWVTDPKKALYNRVYNKTTISAEDIARTAQPRGTSNQTKGKSALSGRQSKAHRAKLDAEILTLQRKGWVLGERTDITAQLIRPAKKRGCLTRLLLGPLLLLFPNRNEIMFVEVTRNGRLKRWKRSI